MSTVEVDGVFTFTIDNLREVDNEVEFEIGNGSVDLTVGSGMAIPLNLTDVQATVASSDRITLSATATLTQAQATPAYWYFYYFLPTHGTGGGC